MNGYSNDLRERIIKAWQNGKTQHWIAATLEVSITSVKRYIQRYRATGSVRATMQRRQQPRISKGYEAQLRALVLQNADLRLDAYCRLWEAETGRVVSIQTMSRMLLRLELRPKKVIRRVRAQ